jgi:hypothetical protein
MAANQSQAPIEPNPDGIEPNPDGIEPNPDWIEPNPDGISVKFRSERSLHGHSLSALKSALQKAVRRGEIQEAGRLARELTTFEDAAGAADRDKQRVRTNFLNRLMVVFLEDVGDAAVAADFVAAWNRLDHASESYPDDVARFARALAGHPKSRACSHARAVATVPDADWEVLAPLYPELHEICLRIDGDPHDEPSWRERLRDAVCSDDSVTRQTAFYWAYRIHTSGAKRRIGRKSKPVYQVFQTLATAFDTLGSGLAEPLAVLLNDAYPRLQNLKENFLCWMLPLVAHVFDHDDHRDEMEAARAATRARLAGDAPADDGGFADRPLQDYAIDMHVRGQRAGDLVRFAIEGAHVENPAPYVNDVWRYFYNDRKRIADGVDPVGPEPAAEPAEAEPANDNGGEGPVVAAPAAAPAAPQALRETDYEFIVRAQLNTSAGRCDTYFAWTPAEVRAPQRLVFVKGPMTPEAAARAVEVMAWKEASGLPTFNLEMVSMIPDRWPDGIPLGRRNRIDREGNNPPPAHFLVSKCLLQDPDGNPLVADNIPVRLHPGTAKWGPTEVVDWEALSWHKWDPRYQLTAGLHETAIVDYCVSLLARYVIGIADQADRNFILVDRNGARRLITVDEDVASPKRIDLAKALRAGRAELISAAITTNREEILAAVRQFTPGLAHPERLDSVIAALESDQPFTFASLA